MIKISYRPIRFEIKDKQDFEYLYDRDTSLKDYLDQTGIDYKDCDIIVEGKTEDNFNKRLDNETEIIVTPKIKDPISAIIATVWAFALAHPFVFWGIVISVLSTIYSVYSALTANARMPNFSLGGDGLDESSPTYGWDGIRTIQEVGIPVKVVYGEHRTGGNILNQYISTDGDKQYLNLLIGVGEGEIESITDIKINEMPLSNFEGIEIDYRYGTNNQTVIPNFADLHNIYPVNVELLKDVPYDIYDTIDDDVEGFEINFTLPGGLFQVTTSGAIIAWDVTYKVEYKIVGAPSYNPPETFTISGKTRTTIRRAFKKTGLSSNKYNLRITRTSENSSLEPQKVGDLYLSSIDEIKTDDLAYPNTALLGIKALATDQLSGQTPNVTFVVKGKKVRIPNILTELGGSEVAWKDYYWDDGWKLFSNGSALYWDGTTYIERWCANPIWCLRDLMVNTRYGLGEYLESENLDDEELLGMAQYCETKVPDGKGGFEKRFRTDVVIDSATKTPDLFSQLCATFRAFAFYSNNGFSFRIDKPELPVQVFGMGNIVKNQFQQSWKSRSEIYNMIQVQMNDKETDYKDETVSIMDEASISAGDPIKLKTLRLFVANKSYALREARYALWIGKYINRTIQIKCGIDAIACKAGNVINIAHDVPQWGFSGRVQAGSTNTSINIDQNVLISGASYKLMVRFADDTIEEKVVTNPTGNYNVITVSEAFSQVPQAYDVYSFGEINKVVKPFRVVGISREKDGECGIAAIEYNESVYDESGIVLPTSNYSALSYEVPNVTDLKLTERLLKLADGTIENVIDVWFNKPAMTGYSVRRYMKARIYISDNDGDSWTERGETNGTHFAIIGDLIDLTQYRIVVVSVGDIGDENSKTTSPQATIDLVGKTALPSDVVSFVVHQVRDRLFFAWTNVTDIDLSGYEIRYGSSWEAGSVLASNIKANRFNMYDFRIGIEQSFWIKAIDTTGNYSENALESIVNIYSIPFQNISESYDEQTAWAGDKSNTETSGDDLIISAGELSGTYTTPERDLGYLATFKIGISTVVTLADDVTWQDFGEDTFEDLDDNYRFTGAEQGDIATFEIRYSEDNITWTDWEEWMPVDYTCRYFQLRMTLTRVNTEQEIACSEFSYGADLPDIDDKIEGEVTVAGDGDDIVFTKEFHKVYGVHITITSGDGFFAKITSLDLVGCNVKLYDEEGATVTGDFLAHIHGV